MYTSQWPAGLVLQGISRHKPLAAITMGAALGNLALSLLLVRRFGLTGVALGTLIPATIVYLGVFLPYVMRIIGVNSAQVLKEMFLPTILPAVPMAIVLYVSVLYIKPVSLFSISVIAMSGTLVYVMTYLSVAICKVERDTCRSFALSTIHLARGYLTRA
jgi:O-antigen/teichoic acid export membrane protein